MGIRAIICALIGIAALAAGIATARFTAPLPFGKITTAGGERLQRLADLSCACERRSAADSRSACWAQFNRARFSGESFTTCDPVSTTSRWLGGQEIIVRREYVGNGRPILLCSTREAEAAENAFYRLVSFDPDGTVHTEKADWAVGRIAAGEPGDWEKAPHGCGN